MLNIYRRVNPAHAADNKGSRELQHMAGWETQKCPEARAPRERARPRLALPGQHPRGIRAPDPPGSQRGAEKLSSEGNFCEYFAHNESE